MNDFQCPECGAEYYSGDFPDHISGSYHNHNRFTFDCACGAVIEFLVDWSPDIEAINVIKPRSVNAQ